MKARPLVRPEWMSAEQFALFQRYDQFLAYELGIAEAEERLIRFCEFTMPSPKHPDDPEKSLYMPARHLEIIADVMESIERREILKAIINAPPRHGKTETATNRMNAWITGKHPDWEIMTATYGGEFAKDFATNVREIINSVRFKQIFPDYFLVQASNDRLVNHLNKSLHFVGRRTPTTGRGGDLILVDDPTKDDREVRYQTYRDDVWQWFTQTLLSRRHHDLAPVVITQTRWHEDDVVGRLTDPTNPSYSAEFADGFTVVDLPAIAEEDDVMGRKPGEALWPERFGVGYLNQMKAANQTSFSSLYQANPTPADGVFYHAEDIHTYQRGELPSDLRWFAASDHAVSIEAVNDPTCMGAFGISPDGSAYVSHDLVWRRIQTTEAVDEMIRIMKTYKPLWWYAERGHISRAIGPFLKKKMQEEEVYCPILEEHPTADKMQRAQSARARAAQGKILLPAFAPWYDRARTELLKFPNGRHDDFVDFLSIIGLKLQQHVAATSHVKKNAPKLGTWGELKASFARQDRQERAARARAGW